MNKNIQEQEEDEQPKKTLKEEIQRIINYYQENKNLFLLIVIGFIFFLIFGYELKFLNILKSPKNKIKNFKKTLKGGMEPGMGMGMGMGMMGMGLFDRFLYNPIFRFIFGINIYERLREEYRWEDSHNWQFVGSFLKWVSYIFQAFILRPFKGIVILFVILLGVSGSFMFPFLIYAVLLYFIGKKIKTSFFQKNQKK